MKSPPPLTIFLAERRWKSENGVLLCGMNYSSLRNVVCKLYCKLSSRSSWSMIFCGSSYGRGGLVDELVRPSEPIVFRICRRQIDLDQHRCGAYSRFCEQDRGDRVSLQVGVALLHQPGRDARDLVPDLGDGQRHVGSPREGITDALPAGLSVRLSVSVEDAPVGLRVDPGERCYPPHRDIRSVGQPFGVG